MSTVWDAPLTRGERAWVIRRTLGTSLSAAAAAGGLSQGALRALESDPSQAPGNALGALSQRQRLRVARRRSGLSTAEVARALGVSRVTLTKWERGADPRLRRFWERFKD